MTGSKKRRSKILLVPIIALFSAGVLLLVTIFSTVYYIASPVINVVNAISDFFSSLNVSTTDAGIAMEDALKEWQNNDGLELETHYSPSCSSFYLAEAVSFYYYDQTAKSIVQDGNWNTYINCFSTTDNVTIFELMKVQYGYEPDGTTKDNIAKLTNSLIAAKISRNNLSDIKSLGFEGSTGCTAAEDRKILESDPMNDFIWKQAYAIGGGNPFYYAAKAGLWDPRQCTTFAWYRFYQYYGYDSGARGSGWVNAEQVVAAHSDKFIESSSPAPGSIVSFPGTQDNPDGHVAFVEKVEGDTVWYSEGNYENHGIRLNTKSSTAALNNQYCGGNACLVYAVPIK